MSTKRADTAFSEEEPQTSSEKLEEYFRELIREELGHEPQPAAKPTPSLAEALWLLLCVADAVLLLLLLPDALLKNERLELVGNLFTWLSGSLFVLGSVWFREKLLAFVRRRAFRMLLVIALPILLSAYVSQLPVVPFRPVIEPDGFGELEVDTKVISEKEQQSLRLSLGYHDFVIRRKHDAAAQDEEKGFDPGRRFRERSFTVGPLELFGASLRGASESVRPRWPLLFTVSVYANDKIGELIVRRVGPGPFDPAYLSDLRVVQTDRAIPDSLVKKDGNTLAYRWPYDQKGTITMWLPYGDYRLSANWQGCGESVPTDVSATPDNEDKRADLKLTCANSH